MSTTEQPPDTSGPVRPERSNAPADAVDPTPENQAPAGRGIIAGVLAAAVALGVGEFFDGLSDKIPSLVVAVAEVLVDYTPGGVIRWSIDTFGASQKTISQVGIVVVSLLIGAYLGYAGRRSRAIPVAGFAAFGLLGAWAAGRNPLSALGWSWVAAILAALAGIVTVLTLLAVASMRPTKQQLRAARTGDRTLADDRRTFLGFSVGALGTALSMTLIGRQLRDADARSIESARESLGAGASADSTRTGIGTGELDQQLRDLGTFDDTPGIASYITPNDDFYLIDTALVKPQVDPATWQLNFTGMVDNPFSITLDEIQQMDLVDLPVTLSCVSNEVGGDLVGTAVWTGVPLIDLLERAGVQDGATQLVGRSVDDWTAGFPPELLYDGRTALLAIGMNGEPLPVKNGFPARLVVAGLYGYVSAVKWIEEIHLTTWEDFDGYWIPRGWGKEGPIKTQSRIDVPRNGSRIDAGRHAIAGVAWAPTRDIQRVEVRIATDTDIGEWQEADLAETLGIETWRQWKFAWDAVPGDYAIQVRATDGDGVVQSDTRVAVAPDGAEGHHTIGVRVS